MARTQADLDAIDSAIASGLMKVRYADGSEMTYRTLAEMKSIRADIAGAVGATPTPRTSYASFER